MCSAAAFDTMRCRFAPSPTGYLHIGGARTALFNYLLAKRLGGKFVIRIEDTDQTRNIAGAEDKLLDDMRWLGLHWDEGPQVGGPHGPYYQSARIDEYRSIARKLIDDGHAYYATETDAELNALREAAKREKRNFRYPRPSHFPSNAEADAARAAGKPVIVRLKVPHQPFTVQDQILGDVTVAAGEVDDFVLLKSDGWPTYHFAVVVDDEHMRITHVLRGQEHLMNTPKHLALQAALGYHTPTYAHLPIILNMDGSKMSKREKDKAVRTAAKAALAAGSFSRDAGVSIVGGDAANFDGWLAEDTQLDSDGLSRLAAALGVNPPEIQIHDFRVSGYLPEVLTNFIALLGWSPGEDREKMTLEEMAAAFSLERIGKTNAKFDRAKLLNFNTTAIAAALTERRVAAIRDFISVNPSSLLSTADEALLAKLVTINEGARVMRDVEVKSASLFVADDAIRFDAKAVKDVLHKGEGAGLRVLAEFRATLATQDDWSPAALDALLRGYAEKTGLGLGKIAQPLRVAVTGTTVSPPIFDTLALLGKDRTLRRIDRAQTECNP
ncbi:MAG: glutamate--tRNA ligase [Phycisphaerae bacterium]